MTTSELTKAYNDAHNALIDARKNGSVNKVVMKLYGEAKTAQSALLAAMRNEKK